MRENLLELREKLSVAIENWMTCNFRKLDEKETLREIVRCAKRLFQFLESREKSQDTENLEPFNITWLREEYINMILEKVRKERIEEKDILEGIMKGMIQLEERGFKPNLLVVRERMLERLTEFFKGYYLYKRVKEGRLTSIFGLDVRVIESQLEDDEILLLDNEWVNEGCMVIIKIPEEVERNEENL